jgi:hypothetical protein
MHAQDLKRWHWVAISIVVGIALSIAWSSIEWDENVPSIGQRDFESGLIIPYPQQGHLSNVTVLPAQEGKYKIIAQEMRNTSTPGVMDLRPVAYLADSPYKSSQWNGGGDQYKTVLDYLTTLKKNNPDMGIAYRYAWWRDTWAVYLLWTGASVLLIGVVWPSVVSLMVGAGLGFKGEEKGPDYDLDRFKSEPQAPKPTDRREPTQAEIDHLKQLETELEKRLEAERLGIPMPSDEPIPGTPGAPSAPRKLEAGPLEAAATDTPEENHDYKGEFYPVDRGAKKKG